MVTYVTHSVQTFMSGLSKCLDIVRTISWCATASGMLSRAHISLPFKSLRKMADDTFFEPRLVRRVFRRTSLCQVCGKSIITAAEIHYSAYHFQHCEGGPGRVVLMGFILRGPLSAAAGFASREGPTRHVSRKLQCRIP